MAKRFKFNLETVLKLRRRREDSQKQVVAEHVGRLSKACRREDLLQRQIGQETDEVRAARGAGVLNIQRIARHRHWLTHLQRNLLMSQGEIRGIEAELAQERMKLAQLARDRQALERLRQRRELAYRKELARRAQQEQDEAALVTYVFGGTNLAGHQA